MMESPRKSDITPIWPANDKIWKDIVDAHNKLVDVDEFKVEKLSGSKSITLVMICAVMEMPIPRTYRLDTERKGLLSHPNSVKDYLIAVHANVPPLKHGKTIEGAVKRFVGELGVSVQAVNEGLEKALKLGRIVGGINKSVEGIRPELQGEIPIWDEILTIYKQNAISGEDIAPDRLKKLIEKLFQNQKRNLHPNWWEEAKKLIRNESEKQIHPDKTMQGQTILCRKE